MRRALCVSLAEEVNRLRRTTAYQPMVQAIGPMIASLREVEGSESTSLDDATHRMLQAGRCIPFGPEVMLQAAELQPRFDMSRQDALILASILTDLEAQHSDEEKWFISRDRKDFSDPAIVSTLGRWNCRLLTKFIDGVRVAQRPPPGLR
jgi:predicted nucleic acid-binding protein